MRGELTFESPSPTTAAVAYASMLGDRLRAARPRELEVLGARVLVRGGAFRFVSSWNLLVGVSSATIDAVPRESHVVVRYDIKVTELLVFCAVATCLALGAAASSGSWFAAFAGPAVVWGWLFGMNYAITQHRMTSVLRETARQAAKVTSLAPVQAAG